MATIKYCDWNECSLYYLVLCKFIFHAETNTFFFIFLRWLYATS